MSNLYNPHEENTVDHHNFQVSIFLAMLLSLTRTIAIAAPLYHIRKNWVLSCSLVYCLVTALESVIGSLDQIDYRYIYDGNSPNCYQRAALGLPYLFQYFLEATNTIVLSVLTFVSLLVTVLKLSAASITRRTPCIKTGNTYCNARKSFLQASITVVIFTTIFLLCNLPMVVNVLLESITTMYFSFPGPIFSLFYMKYYSWMVAKVLCVVLNASLNPIVYFIRMKDFNSWVKERAAKCRRIDARPRQIC